MKKNLQQKGRLTPRISLKTTVIIGAVTIGTLIVIARLIFMNFANSTLTKASEPNNGEIISMFTWETGQPTMATKGPDAIKISPTAYIAFGGRSSTGGLAPGIPAHDINMEIAAAPIFDVDGIDVSIDYKGNEPSGSFFTRGKSLDFGFDKGFLYVNYRVTSTKGYETVSETTSYEILKDDIFRNYRFIYNPMTGKGEIFVNNVIVWNHQGQANTAMYWNTKDNIIIGKGIDGGGIDVPVLDNLVIRSAGTLSPLTESLIHFNLEPKEGMVTINWSTTANNKVDFFTIQRSVNATDFATVTTIKATPSKGSEIYSYTDKNFTTAGVYYYRVKQVYTDGKFTLHNISATKVTMPSSLAIETISPPTFQNSFSVAYTIPEEGKVEWQLLDDQGNVTSKKTIEAPKGRNIYHFYDVAKLKGGSYTLNLLFNDKKLSATVVKI